MSDTLQDFFLGADAIELKEPLAETLGAFTGTGKGTGVPGTFSFTFADVVKMAGHACPTMAGSYLCCQAALRALYPQATPVRGEIAVTVFGDPDEGTYGVMSQAFTLVTGAAPATGFKGLGPLFKRKDLLTFSREKPDPLSMCFEFRRVDTGRAVLVKFSPRRIPFPAEKSKRLGELVEKVAWDAARSEERTEFQALWMEKVRTMLVEKQEIDSWLAVEERSA